MVWLFIRLIKSSYGTCIKVVLATEISCPTVHVDIHDSGILFYNSEWIAPEMICCVLLHTYACY